MADGNIQEGTMIPEGMTEKEVAALSDEQVLAIMIKEKRKRLITLEGARRAGIRRRNRGARK